MARKQACRDHGADDEQHVCANRAERHGPEERAPVGPCRGSEGHDDGCGGSDDGGDEDEVVGGDAVEDGDPEGNEGYADQDAGEEGEGCVERAELLNFLDAGHVALADLSKRILAGFDVTDACSGMNVPIGTYYKLKLFSKVTKTPAARKTMMQSVLKARLRQKWLGISAERECLVW